MRESVRFPSGIGPSPPNPARASDWVSRGAKDADRIAFNEDVVANGAPQRVIACDPAGGAFATLDGDEPCAAARRILARKRAEGRGRSFGLAQRGEAKDRTPIQGKRSFFA